MTEHFIDPDLQELNPPKIQRADLQTILTGQDPLPAPDILTTTGTPASELPERKPLTHQGRIVYPIGIGDPYAPFDLD